MIALFKTEELIEFNKLEQYLKDNGYEYERHDRLPGIPENIEPVSDYHQLIVYKDGVRQWDVICHYGSYGYADGLLEIYGNIVTEEDGDSVVGWLTADDVIQRLKGGTDGKV